MSQISNILFLCVTQHRDIETFTWTTWTEEFNIPVYVASCILLAILLTWLEYRPWQDVISSYQLLWKCEEKSGFNFYSEVAHFKLVSLRQPLAQSTNVMQLCWIPQKFSLIYNFANHLYLTRKKRVEYENTGEITLKETSGRKIQNTEWKVTNSWG